LVLALEEDLPLAGFVDEALAGVGFALAFAVVAVTAVLALALDAGFLASPVTAYRHFQWSH